MASSQESGFIATVVEYSDDAIIAGTLNGNIMSWNPAAELMSGYSNEEMDPLTAAIPMVALSALAMQADKELGQTAGCDAYLVKPLRYEELYTVIDHLVREPQTLAEKTTTPAEWR
jgi:PAS domain-containing protein